MIESAGLKAGDEVQLHLAHVPVELRKGGTKGTPRNPLANCEVTRNTLATVVVSGPQTYRQVLAEHGTTPVGKQPWYEWVRDGVVRHRSGNGGMYFACIPSGQVVNTYFVDGRPATSEEIEAIRAYRRISGTPLMFTFHETDIAAITKA